MTPSYTEPPGSQTEDRDTRAPWSHDQQMFSSNARRRTEGIHSTYLPMARRSSLSDSWVEISSRPSSSSLASTNDMPHRLPEERPSRQPNIIPHSHPPRSASAAGSSQDEYEESSSDSDRVMSSSNEDVAKEEEDDDRTALGVRPAENIFKPQPNAFSHPPSNNRPEANAYFPQAASTPSSFRQDRRPHLQRDRTSGSYQPDHDAALRASLTTLLSCAAAVRPKADKAPERAVPRRASAQPTTLRLVQEKGETVSPRPIKQAKRKSRESSKERNCKKIRSVKTVPVEETFSPTFASWIISASVIVVFSAISFTAGYAWGKEVGIQEGRAGMAGAGCGREVMKGSGRAVNWTRSSTSIAV